MRTTVTLEADTEDVIRRLMRERRLTFKQAVNAAIRAGAANRSRRTQISTPAYSMGEPHVELVKALSLAAGLEDEELRRRLDQGT